MRKYTDIDWTDCLRVANVFGMETHVPVEDIVKHLRSLGWTVEPPAPQHVEPVPADE